MNHIETFYIHALARLAYDASARGKHPIEKEQFMDFFRSLIHDRHLESDRSLDVFDQCYSLEIERGKTRGVKKQWK